MKKRVLRTVMLACVAFAIGAAAAFVQINHDLQATGQAGSQEAPMDHAGHGGHTAVSAPAAEGVVGVALDGTFSLVDHHGNAVTEKSWPGKYQLVFFGFTHCPDICPVAMNKFTDLMVELDPAGERIVPILISVDPERDTPEAMKMYLEVFHKTIVGLTGTQEQVNQAVSAFKVYASVSKHQGAHGEMEHSVNHSGYTYFMSPEGKLLELFDGEDSVKHMVDKIGLHLR